MSDANDTDVVIQRPQLGITVIMIFVLVDPLLLCLSMPSVSTRGLFAIIADVSVSVMICVQILLFGMWFGLSELCWWNKSLVFILSVGWLVIVFHSTVDGEFVLPSAIAVPTGIAMIFCCLRRRGYRLACTSPKDSVLGTFRLSIRTLLIMTTVTAAVLAIRERIPTLSSASILVVLIVNATIVGAMVLFVLLGATLGQSISASRLALAYCQALTISFGLPVGMNISWHDMNLCLVIFPITIVLIGMTLLAFRYDGYRVICVVARTQNDEHGIVP